MDQRFIEYWKNIFENISKGWKKLPPIARHGVIILWMFIMGNSFPWKSLLGDLGGYIQAALLLGAIFYGLRIYNEFQKSKAEKKKHGGTSN